MAVRGSHGVAVLVWTDVTPTYSAPMFRTCRAPGAIRPAPAHADGGGKAAASEHPTDSLTKAITARASGPMTRRGTVSPCRTCLCGLSVCVEVCEECDPGGERGGSTNFNDPRQSWTSRRKPFVYYSVRVYFTGIIPSNVLCFFVMIQWRAEG